MYINTEMAKFAEFALDALKRTRVRELPPSREEIITLLGRRKITATVHCYGGGSCQISIDSSTTSGEVIKILSKGMKLKHDNLIFALFERCGPPNEKSIEDRQILADVLAKFERYSYGANSRNSTFSNSNLSVIQNKTIYSPQLGKKVSQTTLRNSNPLIRRKSLVP